jgi:DNA recombination-dependent growth factor C
MEKVVVTFEIPKDQIKTIQRLFVDFNTDLNCISLNGVSKKKTENAIKTVRNIIGKFDELARNQELEENP